MPNLLILGRGGVIDSDQVVAIAPAKSAPIKRLLEAAGRGARAQPDLRLSAPSGDPAEQRLSGHQQPVDGRTHPRNWLRRRR